MVATTFDKIWQIMVENSVSDTESQQQCQWSKI